MALVERSRGLLRSALKKLGLALFGVRLNKARQVYREEISSGLKPIEAVGTSIAAFIGFSQLVVRLREDTPRDSGEGESSAS